MCVSMHYALPDLEKSTEQLKKLKLGFVSAGLSHMGNAEAAHSKLVRSSVEGATAELTRLKISIESQLLHVNVPGVLEIPLMAKQLIEKHSLDGVIGFAIIINGGVYRHEFVAQASLDLLMKVSLKTGIPIASCLLTPVEPKAPETQFEFLKDHLRGKGQECARALVEQILQLKAVQS